MYNNKANAHELWAVLDSNNCVQWSRGGSSTVPRLMVHPSLGAAERALSSPWTKQMLDGVVGIHIERIYSVSKPEPPF